MKKMMMSLVLFTFLFGCVGVHENINMSQLQIREFQTRSWPTTDKKMVMKATLNTLQDDGYTVQNIVVDAGLVSATRIRRLTAAEKANVYAYTENAECSINITVREKETTIRANFTRRFFDIGGRLVGITTMDEKFYQDFFAKVDKGVFLQKEGL